MQDLMLDEPQGSGRGWHELCFELKAACPMLLAGQRQHVLAINCCAPSTGGHFAPCCCPLLPSHLARAWQCCSCVR